MKEKTYYDLIDRLKKHSEWKYPNRKWSVDTYNNIAFAWVGKIDELKTRLDRLEQSNDYKDYLKSIDDDLRGYQDQIESDHSGQDHHYP